MQHILGQSRALETLQSGLASGRVHHAFIFHGPVGVGKFTAAVAFAKLLLCHERQTTLTGAVEACGNCPSCRLFESGRRPPEAPQAEATADGETGALATAHPDLHVVTKELAKYSDDRSIRDRKLTQIPVEVLRHALLGPVHRRSQMDHGKVFILDEAELLNPTGQNLLLKTLEEPPEGTFLILVTSSEDRLLPTIRSRCQRVVFVPLSDAIVSDWVEKHPAAATLSATDRQWLVSFASGSLGRAALALDYDLTEWARAVLPEMDSLAQRGVTRSGSLGQIIASRIDGFAQAWVDRHRNASKEAANKLAAGLMGALVATHARRRVADLAARADPADPVGAENLLEPWLGVMDAVEEMRRLLASNVNLSLACDHLVSRMARGLTSQRPTSNAQRPTSR